MKFNFRLLGGLVFCSLLASSGSGVQAASLFGSTVTGTLYFPNLQTILNVSTPVTTTVGAGTEFPAGTLIGNTPFTIDITSDQLFYRPLQNGVTYDPATAQGSNGFNGFVFDFLGAPNILGVSVDGLSNFNPVALSFTANSVTFDLKGLSVNAQSLLVIDFRLADPSVVPIPGALPLFATGLAGLGFFAHRRKRKQTA
jgi:hypothetical protein